MKRIYFLPIFFCTFISTHMTIIRALTAIQESNTQSYKDQLADRARICMAQDSRPVMFSRCMISQLSDVPYSDEICKEVCINNPHITGDKAWIGQCLGSCEDGKKTLPPRNRIYQRLSASQTAKIKAYIDQLAYAVRICMNEDSRPPMFSQCMTNMMGNNRHYAEETCKICTDSVQKIANIDGVKGCLENCEAENTLKTLKALALLDEPISAAAAQRLGTYLSQLYKVRSVCKGKGESCIASHMNALERQYPDQLCRVCTQPGKLTNIDELVQCLLKCEDEK